MNYRHAFHAGNFADCVKHALLVEILSAMQRKPKPLLVLDTHAGIGRYDLSGEEASKTGEWRDGIGRLLETRPPALANYLAMVERLGLYPGSPAIAADFLREGDRLIACELHPQDAATLRTNVAQAAVHERDGYAALKAFLPPPERRGLILIDPPFEKTDEFATIAKHLAAAYAKFATGVYVIWYPVKHRAPARAFFETIKLTPIRDVVALEFWRRTPTDPARLNGCGLMVVNPPFGLEAAAAPILQAMQETLGEAGAGYEVETLINE